LGLGALACVRGGAPAGPAPTLGPEVAPPGTAEQTVRVALASNARGIMVGGGSALKVAGPDGAYLGDIDAGDTRRVVLTESGGLAIETPRGRRTPAYSYLDVAAADSGAAIPAVRVEGRDYRGTVRFVRAGGGLVRAVNVVGIETYVASVVSSELGRRAPEEREAVLAQAVVSRTYVLKAQGRALVAGYDVTSGVADQVYGGTANETDLGWDAVRATRGQVLASGGALIDAQFFSTCGGRTANNDEAFRGGARPYLRSISDLDPGGTAYCAASPRFRWHVAWTGAEARATLVRGLAPLGVRAESLRRLHDVRVLGRSASDRITGLVVAHADGETQVEAGRVREVLRMPTGEPLRSTAVELSVLRAGGLVTGLAADGRGAGHGVGMCQWGAVGRARAGQRYTEILSAYFPGANLERRY
jgi:stage II sporulation protein D